MTVDDEDLTVESFRKNVLYEQVDDILNFPCKYIRLVNNKRLVVGAKQEAGMKITRLFDIKTDEKVVHLVREEANCSAEKSAATGTTASLKITRESGAEEPSLQAENTDVGSPAPKGARYHVSPRSWTLPLASRVHRK